MAEQVVDHPSVVRVASAHGSSLHLSVWLFDTISPPSGDDLVLELVLHGCSEGAEPACALLQDCYLSSIKQHDAGDGLVLRFCDGSEEVASVTCKRVSHKRRAFAASDWLHVVGLYERWLEQERDDVRHWVGVVREMEQALAQRQDRARRVEEQSAPGSRRSLTASGKRAVLEELETVLRRLQEREE